MVNQGGPVIAFTSKDTGRVGTPHDNSFARSLRITNCIVRRILVDNGSSVKIMFIRAFEQMELLREDIQLVSSQLVGFDGSSIVPIGTIRVDNTVTGTTFTNGVHDGKCNVSL